MTFEKGNADDLRSKVQLLLSNPSKMMQMGKNARTKVENDLDSEGHYKKLMKIYETVV